MAIVQSQTTLWNSVLEQTKASQEKGSDPLLWAINLSSNLASKGVSLPSLELANILVSHICWDNNIPIAWKFLEQAICSKLVPPLLVLSLLSQRVIPCRLTRPAAYRLYMELLKRHALTLKSRINGANFHKVMNLIDKVLQLSQTFGLEASDPNILLVEYIFSTIWQLLDASLDDEGLLELTPEKKSKWVTKSLDTDASIDETYSEKRIKIQDRLRHSNTVMAVELIGQFLQNRVTSRILYLARQNMATHWGAFVEQIQLLLANSSALINSQITTAQNLLKLTSESHIVPSKKRKLSSLQYLSEVITCGPTFPSSLGFCHGASRSTLWLPLDLALEDAMDGSIVNINSSVEIISGLMKSLQAFNGTTWHESFLGLWMAALRLVQRERDPIEGPVPLLDTRLCMLLTIITLVVVDLIEQEALPAHDREKRRLDLVSSLQSLGDYKRLLTPPQSVISAADQAAAKAMMFVSGVGGGSSYLDCISIKDMSSNCSGNMHHLIVEACIARNLLDTSAYFWPGYVNRSMQKMSHTLPVQVGWLSFMNGAPLTQSMIRALVSSPAS